MLSLVQQQLLPLQTSHFPEKHLPGFLMPIPHPLPEKRTLTPPFPHTRCYSTGYLCHTCSFSLLLPQLSQLCARAWFASPPRSPFRSQICLTCPEKVPFGGTLSQHRLECSCVSRNDSLEGQDGIFCCCFCLCQTQPKCSGHMWCDSRSV